MYWMNEHIATPHIPTFIRKTNMHSSNVALKMNDIYTIMIVMQSNLLSEAHTETVHLIRDTYYQYWLTWCTGARD